MTDFIDFNKIQDLNLQAFLQMVSQIDPELYYIALALSETGVNPLIIPRLIRAIHNLAIGTGFGTITILMDGKKITGITTKENDLEHLNDEAIIK
jgi:hypothetical protein